MHISLNNGTLVARLMAAAVILAGVLPLQTHAADTLSPLGKWARTDGTTRMTVSSCGTQLCAVNTWVNDPSGAEKVGDKLVMTLRQTSPTVLSGSAFDVRRNKSYSMTITLTSDGMKTTGCVLLGVLCKAALWTREG